LIERVAVRWDDCQPVIILDGALTALIGLAQNAKSPARAGFDGIDLSSLKLVAGAGFEPAAFRL
jgi:site-specific DNA recombinase